MVLNATHALLGNPSIHPAHTSSSRSSSGGGGNAVKDPESPTTTESLADSFLGLFTSAPKSSPSEDTQMDSRMHSDDDLHQNPAATTDNSVDVNPDAAQQRLFHNNIVPAALSELDVRRLAWAVQKVRQIMSNMVEQGTIGKEVFPGASLQEVHGEATLPRAQQGSEVEDGGLHAWVIFFLLLSTV